MNSDITTSVNRLFAACSCVGSSAAGAAPRSPRKLESVILRLPGKNPDDRFATARETATALADSLTSTELTDKGDVAATVAILDVLSRGRMVGRAGLDRVLDVRCYNCRNTLPFVKSWDDRYREKGLTVIGVHSPEFDEERNVKHLRREVASLGIRYPVVTDNDYRTWSAYKVEAWPTIFLLDKQGRIRLEAHR